MKKIVAILMAMLMVISVTVVLAGGVATTKEKQSEKVPVILMFKDKTDKDLIKQHGGELKCVYQIKPAVAVSLPQKAIDALEKNPEIAFIVPDLEIFTMAETLDWGVDRIDADIVHGYNIWGTGVKVAIMDTGIDYDHPDLAANYKGGYDFGGE
jgi:subtilisin